MVGDMTIEWADLGRSITALIVFAGVIAVSVVYILSQVKKANQSELEDLARTRGETIDDLREEVRQLSASVAELQVKVKYLEDREINQIIEGVVKGVVKELK